jgi:fermentation-respiration switch protein FrsA (DUF1100 family)
MNKKRVYSWVKSIFRFAVTTILVLIGLLVVAGFVEVNKALHPPRLIPPGNTLRKYEIPYQSVSLVTEDGIRLAAWYTPPKNGVVILLAHGYGDNRPEWVYEMLAKKKYGVLAWDARAHGESGGEISTIGYLEILDVKAALNFALVQPDVKHIGAWGGSMGAATIIRAAATYPQIEAVFVDSSFDSLDDELDYLVPYPFLTPLAKLIAKAKTGINLDEVSPLADIGRISPRPVFIVHSTADIVAPPDAGQKLFEAAKEPRFLWVEQNAPHLAIYLENPRRYQRRLVGFFDEWLLGN